MTAEHLVSFLGALVVGIVTAVVSVQLALRRFRSERWWDGKTEASGPALAVPLLILWNGTEERLMTLTMSPLLPRCCHSQGGLLKNRLIEGNAKMRSTKVGIILLLSLLTIPVSAFAQNPIQAQQFRGLTGLESAALMLQVDTVPPAGLPTLREWSTLIELRMHRDLPELKLADRAPAWLVLSVFTAGSTASISLAVYRWVGLPDTEVELAAKVWEGSRIIVSGVSRTPLEDAVGAILTSLAADYVRANR